jgi:hypothetical protein
MRDDTDIHHDIGQLLANLAPEGARAVIMRARLSHALDACQYEYDCVDEQGNTDWFTAGGRANADMLSLLIALRRWHEGSIPTAPQCAWSGCDVTLHLDTMKLHITFIYP